MKINGKKIDNFDEWAESLIRSFEEAEEKRISIKNLRMFRKAQERGTKTRNARREIDRAYAKKRV